MPPYMSCFGSRARDVSFGSTCSPMFEPGTRYCQRVCRFVGLVHVNSHRGWWLALRPAQHMAKVAVTAFHPMPHPCQFWLTVKYRNVSSASLLHLFWCYSWWYMLEECPSKWGISEKHKKSVFWKWVRYCLCVFIFFQTVLCLIQRGEQGWQPGSSFPRESWFPCKDGAGTTSASWLLWLWGWSMDVWKVEWSKGEVCHTLS